jgi:hypothetical protein
LGRILDKEEIVKDMKECWIINKPRVISALKKSKMKEVHDILELVEDCATEDEKGGFIIHFN